MIRKLILSGAIVLSLLGGLNNGYYQTTEIRFEGIEETCYGTLLCDKTVSGSWDAKQSLDLQVDSEVTDFFKSFADPDHYFYLNYLQDVSEGYMYWPIYPPEKFKVLLYFPESGSHALSEPLERYSLTSPYRAKVENGIVYLERDFDMGKLATITLLRILFLTGVALLVTAIYRKMDKDSICIHLLWNVPFTIFINVLIAWHSYKYGFSFVDYFASMWLPYLLAFFIEGTLLKRHTNHERSAFLCSFFSNLFTCFAGLLLADLAPQLFTVI